MRRPVVDSTRRYISLWRSACKGTLPVVWARRFDRESLASIIIGIRTRYRIELGSFIDDPEEVASLEHDALIHMQKMAKRHKEVESELSNRAHYDAS